MFLLRFSPASELRIVLISVIFEEGKENGTDDELNGFWGSGTDLWIIGAIKRKIYFNSFVKLKVGLAGSKPLVPGTQEDSL